MKANREQARFIAGVGGMLGVCAVFLGFAVFGMDLWPPSTLEKIVLLLWLVSAGLGAGSLLAFANGPDRLPKKFVLFGLVTGDVTVAATLIAIPPAVMLLVFPVAAGAIVVSKLYDKRAAIAFALFPLLVLALRAAVPVFVDIPTVWN